MARPLRPVSQGLHRPILLPFRRARRFQIGGRYRAASFLQITAPEISNQLLTHLLDTDDSILVSLHIRSMDQSEALYYGPSTTFGNIILADRKQLKTPNGLILGTPDSGKSFSAKWESSTCSL